MLSLLPPSRRTSGRPGKTPQAWRQHGVGLVELLIAAAIGLFLLAGLTDFLSRSLVASGRNLQDARLTQDLNVAMDLITRDLRRAGYSSTAQDATLAPVASDNPFTAGNEDGGINMATAGCILYSYDFAPSPAVPGARDPNERLGFRLRDGAVEAGINVDNCNPAATAGWQQLTDPTLTTITGLTFEYLDADGNVTTFPFVSASKASLPDRWAVCTRLIRVTLTGQLLNTPAVNRTLTQNVRVRNDWYRYSDWFCEPD